MRRLTSLVESAKQIYHTEGFVSLVRRGFAFLAYCLFERQTYYLYADLTEDLLALHDADFKPSIDGFTLKIVSSNEEADELEAEGLQFRSHVHNARRRLDKGAVAFCIFIDNELAHIGWVVMTQQAKDSLKAPPVKVEFSENEAYSGDAWTSPDYRRMGLSSYGYMRRLRFLLNNGIVTNRTVANKSNVLSLQFATKTDVPPYAEGRYLRILWWKSWREKPLTQG
ncbi:MAG: hypothetical protein KAT75_11975 [Dehalococcoidia bacterium]|nr:hypothetical protein [Dehalococcoidia bacterium]